MNANLINIKELGGIRTTQDVHIRGAAMGEFPTITDAYLVVKDGKIADFGPMSGWKPNDFPVVDCSDRCVLPALVDSHTHIVYAGTREGEFVQRLKGATYAEIAAAGGGILNSAKKVQEASIEELVAQALPRIQKMVRYGTGTIEIKSGYGLTPEAELKLLRAIKLLQVQTDATLVPTFLAAHAVPKDYNGDAATYTAEMIAATIDTVVNEDLAKFIDIFVERDYFKTDALATILAVANKHNMPAKIHVNQFYDIGGVRQAIEGGALSVDHLEVNKEETLDTLAKSNTVATLLPTCSYFLSIPYAPARTLIDSNAIVALATDYNPGSTPSGNMQLVMNMACTQLKMTPQEALNAATLNGAAALNLQQSKGSITVGKDADLLITYPQSSIPFLCYDYGMNHIEHVYLKGKKQ